MKTPSRWTIIAALLAVYILWGSTYLAIRVAIDTLPPLLMAGMRYTIAGATLFAFAAPRGDRAADPIGATQWIAALIAGAGLLLLGNGGVVWAERTLPTGIASLCVATTPVWMAIMDRAFYGARLHPRALVGLVLGFAGLAMLVNPHGGFDVTGALFVVGAAISWAAASLYSRTAPLPKRALVATAMELLAGGILLVFFGLVRGEGTELAHSHPSLPSIVALAYLVVFGSWIGFSAYAWLLRAAPIGLVSTYAYVNPVVAVALGALFLHEPITPRMVGAGGVILAGVALIVTARGKPAKPVVAVSSVPESDPSGSALSA